METDDTDETTQFQRFENADKVKEFMKNYNEKHFTNFIVLCNNKRSMALVCKHGIHRDSKSKGKRENLSYNFLGCTAKIRLYKSQIGEDAGTMKVTSVDIKHNHTTS